MARPDRSPGRDQLPSRAKPTEQMSVPVSIHRISDISFFFRFQSKHLRQTFAPTLSPPSLKRTGSGMIAEVRPSGCEPFLRSEKPPQGSRSLQSVSNSRTIRFHPTGSGRTIGPGCSPRLRPIFLHRLVHLALGVVLLEVLALIVGLAPPGQTYDDLGQPRSLRKSRKPTTVNPCPAMPAESCSTPCG